MPLFQYHSSWTSQLFYIASQPHPVQLLKDGMSLSPFSFLITMMETTLFLHMMQKLLKYSDTSSSLSKKNTHTQQGGSLLIETIRVCSIQTMKLGTTTLFSKEEEEACNSNTCGHSFLLTRAVIENNSYYLMLSINQMTQQIWPIFFTTIKLSNCTWYII